MPPEVEARAFEPFFTTKDVGKGTGLGLDICRRLIVDRHHGQITIDSSPDGTVLSVRLPRPDGADSCSVGSGVPRAGDESPSDSSSLAGWRGVVVAGQEDVHHTEHVEDLRHQGVQVADAHPQTTSAVVCQFSRHATPLELMKVTFARSTITVPPASTGRPQSRMAAERFVELQDTHGIELSGDVCHHDRVGVETGRWEQLRPTGPTVAAGRGATPPLGRRAVCDKRKGFSLTVCVGGK